MTRPRQAQINSQNGSFRAVVGSGAERSDASGTWHGPHAEEGSWGVEWFFALDASVVCLAVSFLIDLDGQALVLYASVSGNPQHKEHQDRLQALLNSHGVAFTLVDGTVTENKDLRTQCVALGGWVVRPGRASADTSSSGVRLRRMFALSGKKAVYPQVFLERLDDGSHATLEFVCDFDMFHSWNENEAEDRTVTRAFARVTGKDVGSRASSTPELAAGLWQENTSETGEKYYLNLSTGETTWTRPLELGGSDWSRFVTDEGKPYFHNRRTNECVWEKPEGFVE